MPLMTNPSSTAAHGSRDRESATALVHIVCNGQPRTVASGVTVADLLVELALPPRQVAVEVNLELVPRAAHTERTLVEGDCVEIVSLVGGG
jgi:sulfur carrier protein